MDFVSYVKAKNKLPEDVLSEATNNHLVRKMTFYEELSKNASHYKLSEQEVITWAIAAGDGDVIELKSTNNFSTKPNDYDMLGGVSECIKRQVICLRDGQQNLVVLTKRPDDNGLLGMLNKVFGPMQYTLAICTAFIWSAVMQMYVTPLDISSRARSLSAKGSANKAQVIQVQQSEARDIYDRILKMGIEFRASDIHIQPRRQEAAVLYRIDGDNHELLKIPLNICERITQLLTVDGKTSAKGEFDVIDGKLQYNPTANTPNYDPKLSRDLRFSLMPAQYGKDINIRFLNDKTYTFEGLGMSKANVQKFKDILARPQGMIVQVGPTGSGKSTTMYTGLQYLKETTTRNIITAEDPVEIKVDGITQITVNIDAGLTFAKAAKQFLRHDVDVGVIGEIRDEDTALEAVRIANTGHLVITSLHTNDSIGVLERLNRLGVDSYTLGEVLVAIMGQRLVKRLCPHCKQEYTIRECDEIARKFEVPSFSGERKVYKAVGCEHCRNSGYIGRVAVNEILVADSKFRDLVQHHATRLEIEKYLMHTDFRPMYSDALTKVMDGITSFEELESMRVDNLAFKVSTAE